MMEPVSSGASLPSFPREFNLADYFLDARLREGRGDRVAVVVGDARHTYAEIQAEANRVRHALAQAGVGREDRVLMLLPDGVEFVSTWFGILKAGAVFCMGNPLVPADDFEYLLSYTRAKAVVAHASTLERLAPALRRLPADACPVRWVVGESDAASSHAGHSAGFVSWEDALDGASTATENVPTTRDDIAGWLFTSGTTGKPKGAVHLHRHFAFNTECYAKRTLGLTEDDVFVSVSRLFFGYATGTNLMFPFAVGGTAVLFPDKPTPDRIFDHVEKHGVTVLTNVPAMIRQMVDSERDADLSTLRICLSAGEALPAELYKQWKSRFPSAEILDGIGSAEMFHIYITNRLGDVKLGSLGRLVEGYEAKVMTGDAGPDAEEVPRGEVGRLWVAGDSTALWYYGDQDKSRETFFGRWCVSADLFRQDEDGYFYYVGRGDDLLKVRGMFISPLEIENCLLGHPAVKECAVVGVSDDAGLTIPKAFVVLREGHEPDASLTEALQEHAKSRLARYKFPREVEYRTSLPRNDRGKVVRRLLSQPAAQPTPSQA